MSQGAAATLFGTDGIRGKAGEFPLDEQTVERIGYALVTNLAAELGRSPRLVIGRDTRESGPLIESALTLGALAAGATVESAGVITTPGVAYITRARGLDAGVVISASHNPYRDNGIKVFSPSGKKLADEMEQRIERDIAAAGNQSDKTTDKAAKAAFESPSHAVEYQEQYLAFLINEVASGLRFLGMRIGIDCANGAAWSLAP